jgi:branched-chain amino acid transport system substrate-binding protein
MKTNFIMLIIIIILFFISWPLVQNYFHEEKQPIRIAFIGPMSGKGAAAGELMSKAIKLYFEEINREREKKNRRKFELDTFDDEDKCSDKAKAEALQIVKENKAVAVIGHWYSSCSITGGEVYKKYGIPAITPGSVKKEVTEGNPWYFRNIYNASASGQFLAYYIKKVLGLNHVTIIHDNSGYGSYLATEFEKSASQLDMEIKTKWDYPSEEYRSKDKNDKEKQKLLDEQKTLFFKKVLLPQLKENTESTQEPGAILLAVQGIEGVPLVKLIKDADIKDHIISGSGFSEQTFKDGFDQFPKEIGNPGFYMNDIYVATPLIFDTANEMAQKFKERYIAKHKKVELEKEELDWSAAYAYDTAMLLVKAIEQLDDAAEKDDKDELHEITGNQESIQAERERIRDALTNNFNEPGVAVEGTTGFNYFDENRDAQKPVTIGVYKNKKLVSALTQFQVVRNPNEVPNLEAEIKKETRVLKIGENNYYKTNVVYTGIIINNISYIKKNLTFLLDFNIWFRSRSDFNPQDIEFINVADKLEKDAVVIEKIEEQLKRPLKEETKNQMTYRLYRIKSYFKADFFSNDYTYKQRTLGVSFHHKSLTRNNLIYVTDVLGIGNHQSVLEEMRNKQVLNQTTGWSIVNHRFFQDIAKKSSLGNPEYLNMQGGKVEYSQFNAIIQIKKNEFTLRGKISEQYAYYIMWICLISILLLHKLSNKYKKFSRLIWFFESIFAFILLLSGEVLLVYKLSENIETYNIKFVIRVFDMLWWIIPAILVNLASEHFIWTPIEQRTSRNIPNIVRLFLAFIIYFFAVVGIIAFVYDQQLTSILATSGVIAMIIGLAIQINISNIFSGIAINMERPFRLRDWVKIGDFDEGEVIDITWRTTRIKTRKECILCIPNSIASESPILNFCYPDEVYWLWPTVYVHPMHHPERVNKILLDALLSSKKVLKDPAPVVLFTGINEWAASYWIAFCANNYADKHFILQDVWTRVWLHLNRAGITPAVQRQEVHFFKGVKERGGKEATKPITLLKEIDLFKPFSEEAKQNISQKIRHHRFEQGDEIVQQGDAGDSLFIIVEGVVAVQVKTNDGRIEEAARLGAGNFFGEMALLTGEERKATVIALADTYLFELTKADIKPLINDEPEVSELISKVLSRRQDAINSIQKHIKHDVKIQKTKFNELLDKINIFFGNN